MLKEMSGHVLTPNNSSRQVYVCHQVNCRGVMGSGLAKQIKERFPDNYDAYKFLCDLNRWSPRKLIGKFILFSCPVPYSYAIVNIFAQDEYGHNEIYTEYDALSGAFETMYEKLDRSAIYRFPYKLGCGHGGGDWRIVEKLIQEKFVKRGIDVEIWKS